MPPRKAPNRKPTHKKPPKQHNASRNGGKRPPGPNWGLIIAGGTLALAAIVLFILWICGIFDSHYQFQRTDLDNFLTAQEQDTSRLEPGAAIYVDFSNGMNYGYAEPTANQALRDVLNKLTGDRTPTRCYALADGRIEELQMTANQVYDRILAPSSFSQEQAPIQQTLATIVDRRQPALLITDFEEYDGTGIKTNAYAKDYLIAWLRDFAMVAFYKIDYMENGRQKKLFFTVFDDNARGLYDQVEQALHPLLETGRVQRFVIGGKRMDYPTCAIGNDRVYMKAVNGGNYHDAEGTDRVSAVREDGSAEAYKRYYGNVATQGGKGVFLNLATVGGMPAEFYPIGVKSWADVLKNADDFKSANNPKDKYRHFFQGILVNFGLQNGYTMDGAEARCFDLESLVEQSAGKNRALKAGQAPVAVEGEAEEVPDFFTAFLGKPELSGDERLPEGWQEIFVDFSLKFSGTFASGVSDRDLFRLNVVIKGARPNLSEAETFFGWPGNPSLAASVRNTLQSGDVNPAGHILWSYFFRIMR